MKNGFPWFPSGANGLCPSTVEGWPFGVRTKNGPKWEGQKRVKDFAKSPGQLQHERQSEKSRLSLTKLCDSQLAENQAKPQTTHAHRQTQPRKWERVLPYLRLAKVHLTLNPLTRREGPPVNSPDLQAAQAGVDAHGSQQVHDP